MQSTFKHTHTAGLGSYWSQLHIKGENFQNFNVKLKDTKSPLAATSTTALRVFSET